MKVKEEVWRGSWVTGWCVKGWGIESWGSAQAALSRVPAVELQRLGSGA